MAIGYLHVEIVHAGGDSSAVGLSAYIARDQRTDLTTGEHYSFSHLGDLVATGRLVPAEVPAWAQDGEALWNRAIQAELTKDRQTGEIRFKKGAQTAKHFVLALPQECSDAEREQLTTDWLETTFGGKGVALEWAIHRPDEDSDNHHAHIIVSTRYLGPEGFGKKARELNPQFATAKGKHFVSEQDHWERQWTAFQNTWFTEHGIELEVDPFKLVPERIEGKARFIEGAENVAENAERMAAAREAILDPEVLLMAVTERAATFTRQDLKRHLKVNGVVGAEAGNRKLWWRYAPDRAAA